MNKVVKIIALIVLSISLCVAGLFFYFQKNIQPIIISEINKSLQVKVSVDKISVSGFRDFPKLGIKFTQINIDESTPYFNSKLLQAKEINLFLNIYQLYQGEYVIDEIIVREGTIRIADLATNTNYDIFKPTNEKDKTEVNFEIEKLKLEHCNLVYANSPNNSKISGYSPSSEIKIKYSNQLTYLDINSKLEKGVISVDNDMYVDKRDFVLKTTITIDDEKKKIEVSPSEVIIDGIKLSSQGKIQYADHNRIDISFKNAETGAQQLIQLLPPSMIASLGAYDLTGNMTIQGYIRGSTHSDSSLSLGLHYGLNKANLTLKENKIGIRNLTASGDVLIPNLNRLDRATVNCDLQSATSGKNHISGKITVIDFLKPKIQWKGKAKLDPVFLSKFTDQSNFSVTQGSIGLNGTLSFTYFTDKSTILPNSLNYLGNIAIENIQGKIIDPPLTIHKIDVLLSSENNNLIIQNGIVDINNTHALLNGSISNIPSLFDGNGQSKMSGDLIIDQLNLNDFFGTESAESNHSNPKPLLPFPLELKTSISQFKINDFEAESIDGLLVSDQNSVRISDLKIKALGGDATGKVSFQTWGKNYLLDINSNLKNISIFQLFKQFNNFYQDEITYQNISGDLNGTIHTKIILDSKFEPILPKLYVKSNIEINNGALIGYEPLKELSTFVKIDDLENVTFKTLKNSIEIFDQTIFIPKMKIENNALNLVLEGSHTFENYMNYSMELSVAELLATKANWIAKKAEKRIERNKNGGLTAYVLMEGTPEDLKIKYDRTSVKNNIKDEMKNEKRKFIQTLKGENIENENSIDLKNYDDVWDE